MTAAKESFRDQLAELRRTRYARVPRVRYIMQSFLQSTQSSEDHRANARSRVLDWARTHWPGLVPAAAYEGKAFEHDQAGLRIAATGNEDGSIWSFRSEHLGEFDALGVRNSCSTLDPGPVPASSPRFLREFVAHHQLTDGGFAVGAAPLYVGDHEFEAFLDMLMSSARTLPVVVLTRGAEGGRFAVNPAKLAVGVQGLAHVVCLEPSATFRLSDRLGRRLSVYDGAVRTYYAGVQEDEAWHHPLVMPQRIKEWVGEDLNGPAAFEKWLVAQLHFDSVDSAAKIEQLPSYFAIRRSLLDKPDKTTAEEMEYLKLELDEARSREREWKALADDCDTESVTTQEENRRLHAQNRALAEELRAMRATRGENEIPIPSGYDAMPRWADTYFADRLVLHSRAVRAMKDAAFKDVRLVYKALRLLSEDYWAMCANTDPGQRKELVARWQAGLKALNLEYNSHALAENRLGEFRDQYSIDYRIGQKTRQVLGAHLKYGTSKDERYCMRIYYLWDDERQLVVVGHLPSHLDTRTS